MTLFMDLDCEGQMSTLIFPGWRLTSTVLVSLISHSSKVWIIVTGEDAWVGI